MGRRGHPPNFERNMEVLRMYSRFFTFAEIASAVNITRQRAHQIVKHYGAIKRPMKRDMVRAKLDKLARLYACTQKHYIIDENGCHIWAGCTVNGTPRTQSSSTRRVVYKFHYGNVPDGKYIFMKCGNRLCINPDHMMFKGDKHES